jgi:hypothetical protein
VLNATSEDIMADDIYASFTSISFTACAIETDTTFANNFPTERESICAFPIYAVFVNILSEFVERVLIKAACMPLVDILEMVAVKDESEIVSTVSKV